MMCAEGQQNPIPLAPYAEIRRSARHRLPSHYDQPFKTPTSPSTYIAYGSGPQDPYSGDPCRHQGLESVGPQTIGTAGEVPLLEVCT